MGNQSGLMRNRSKQLRDKLCILESRLKLIKMPADSREYLSGQLAELIQSADILHEYVTFLELQ